MKRALQLIGIAALALVATLVAMTALPHADYIRWQSMKSESFARLGWIYERAHFDPTPVDIAFVGTSHTLNGVDAQAVAQGLWSLSLRNLEGRCPTVANFAMPEYGRNLHWVVAREVLQNKNVDVLVLEVFENESRKPHHSFIYAATTGDVISAPKLINLNAAGDLARLPFRQLSLAVASAAPGAFGFKPAFDPALYDGSTVDNTRAVKIGGQVLVPARDRAADPAELDDEADARGASKDLNLLPERFADLEYAVPNRYLDQILDLANAKGVTVLFLYLPGYRNPTEPYDPAPYAGRGQMMFPATDLLRDPRWWYDADHLTAAGAAELSLRLPTFIQPALTARGWRIEEQAGEPCSNGYPERDFQPLTEARHG